MNTSELLRDLRHGLRRLLGDWRFSAAAVLILGLGIGANTAIFSLVNAVLFRHAPLAEPDRLVDLYQNASNPGGIDANSYPAYLDMAERSDVFAAVTSALVPRPVRYQHEGALHPAVAEHTTASYLSVLGLAPSLGRWFSEAEDVPGATVVAVIGHRTWIRAFNADPSVIGRIIRIDGVPATIVGIGPAGHDSSVNVGMVTDFWLPVSSLTAMGAPPDALARRPQEAGFFVKARLKDGVTPAQAQAAMDILGRRLASQYPNEDPGRGIRVVASSEVRIHPQLDAPITAIAMLLLALVGLVLAIACSNLATLLLVRGASRAKEIAVRLAIGATRGVLVRQLLVESLLLALAGGLAGCLLAWWGVASLRTVELPVRLDVTLDARVLAFALAVTLVTGVAWGLAPALAATRLDLVPALREAGGKASTDARRLSLRNALIAFQVAVSVLLLGCASIFGQMLAASRSRPLGYAVDGVAMLETDSRYAGYSPTRATSALEDLRRRVAAIPGVEAAALTRGLPMRTTGLRLVVEGVAPGNEPAVQAGSIWAGPEYFTTLGIPLVHGRAFDTRDGAGTPRVALVSEAMARQAFGSVNAVGRRFRLESDPDSWTEVVGVVGDTATADRQGDLDDPQPRLLYRPFAQSGGPPTTVVARTSRGAAALLVEMQQAIRTADPALPVVSAKTMAQDLEDSLAVSKGLALVLAALGALGLSLAGTGLYAVVAFVVSRRSREIGIRLALGAPGRQVAWSVTREVAGVVGAGTAIGLLLTALATLGLRAAYAPAPGLSLYRPHLDPAALAAVAAIMALVGTAAAFVPARRAALADPLTALRRD